MFKHIKLSGIVFSEKLPAAGVTKEVVITLLKMVLQFAPGNAGVDVQHNDKRMFQSVYVMLTAKLLRSKPIRRMAIAANFNYVIFDFEWLLGLIGRYTPYRNCCFRLVKFISPRCPAKLSCQQADRQQVRTNDDLRNR